jgi:hypothetical protein
MFKNSGDQNKIVIEFLIINETTSVSNKLNLLRSESPLRPLSSRLALSLCACSLSERVCLSASL